MTSIISGATTLVNPTSSSSSTSSTAPCYSTFLGTYSKLGPDLHLLTANGYPAEYTNKGLLAFAQSSKEIKVEIPTVAFKITSMSNSNDGVPPNLAKASPEGTLFSSKKHLLKDVRNRGHLSKLMEMLIGRRCEKPRFCFSEEIVKSKPKESSNTDLRFQTSVEYQYSTASLVAPLGTDRDEENLSEAELDRLLDEILNHLDSRGVLWTHAGRLVDERKSEIEMGNSQEQEPKGLKFLVLGAFPKPFISRSKSFNPQNSSVSDALPSDLSHSQDSNLTPLILDSSQISDPVSTSSASASASGSGSRSESRDGSGTGKGKGNGMSDVLEGFRLSFTREPFRGGAKGFDTPRGSGMGSSAHAFGVAGA